MELFRLVQESLSETCFHSMDGSQQETNAKDKLSNFQVISNYPCVLCNWEKENMDHLFFKCKVSSQIWGHMLSLCNQRYVNNTQMNYIEFCARRWKKHNLQNIICKLCLIATIYYRWRERNNIPFHNGRISLGRVILQIKEIVQERASFLNKIKKSYESEDLASKWGLPCCIFKEV